MSAFRSTMLLRPAVALRQMNNRAAAFSTGARRFAGKEDKLHTEGRAQEIEREKADSVQKAKKGDGEWKDNLASSSESIIKAERGEVEASESTIKKLQKESADAMKNKK